MRLILSYLFVALLLNVTDFWGKAQEESQIPATAWEQHPEGVALALMLAKAAGNDSQSTYLILFVKNTSNNPVPMMGGPAIFFYLDSSGKPVILGNHHDPHHPEDNVIENCQRWRVIPPGKISSTGTRLTASEVELIKTITVQCKILLLDRNTHKEVPVTGSPQLLNP